MTGQCKTIISTSESNKLGIIVSSTTQAPGAQIGILWDRSAFLELQYFDRHLSTTRKRKSYREKPLVFSPGRFSKLYFKNEKIWSSMTTIRAFFPEIRAHFYNFWKRAEEILQGYAPEFFRIMLKIKSSKIFIELLGLSFPCQTCISHHGCQKFSN